jgi:hypothetical protein
VITPVYLVWGRFGLDPVRRFVASYLEHPAGAEHELVFLLNGVSAEQRRDLEMNVAPTRHSTVALAEPSFDIAAYRQAATSINTEAVCFLNSYSVILAPNWLSTFATALSQPEVGLVGATGTWSSSRSWIWNSLGLPGVYHSCLPRRAERRAVIKAAELALEVERGEETAAEDHDPPPRARLREIMSRAKSIPVELRRTPWFPNPFIRTNAFAIRTELFSRLELPDISAKEDTYGMEGGRRSLTRQVRELGMNAVVVDRFGTTYGPDEWPRSDTFWQDEQEGLLISDNQTRLYTDGGIERRRLLSGIAWGPQARPAVPLPRDE